MGAAMARVVFDVDRPTVGLLNVGVEEIKGVEAVKVAWPHPARSNLKHLTITASSRATTSARARSMSW
jgi:glycerol-3-phosphate acyltransferase PlsX